MDGDKRRLREILVAVQRLPVEQREAHIVQACAGGPELAAEVRAVLADETVTEGVLQERTAGPDQEVTGADEGLPQVTDARARLAAD